MAKGQKNLYQILELEPPATVSDVKSAYYRLAKIRHPDAGGTTDGFMELKSAHEVLSDERKKKKYDLMLGVLKTAQEQKTRPGAYSTGPHQGRVSSYTSVQWPRAAASATVYYSRSKHPNVHATGIYLSGNYYP